MASAGANSSRDRPSYPSAPHTQQIDAQRPSRSGNLSSKLGIPAHSAAASGQAADPSHAAPTWSIPLKFLPVPKDFTCSGSSARIDLRQKSHSQLQALAARHNSRNGIKQDPFEAVLKGIPERAKLRPDSKVATTHTMGTLCPTDSIYAKAWKSIKKRAPKTSGKGYAADAAAKRAEAAAAAARLAKLQGKPQDAQARALARQQQQVVVPPEQMRWRSKLAAFLGRPVEVPLLAPDAPVLDLNKLFLEVMQQGGYKAVNEADYWPTLAQHMQRDADLADQVFAVYNCYLHPLELDLPYGFRPARAIDHLVSKTQLREGLGCRVASFEAVTFAADNAWQAIKQVAPWSCQPIQQQQQKQQQQQESQPDGQQLQSTASLQQQSNLVHDVRLLLRQAAVQPELAVLQLQQHGLAPGLHIPSRVACIAAVRRTYANILRRSKGAAAADGYEEGEQELDFNFKQDLLAPEPVVAAAAAATGSGQTEQQLALQTTPSKQQQQQQQQQHQKGQENSDDDAAVAADADAAGGKDDDAPAAKRTRRSSSAGPGSSLAPTVSAEQQQQQQQQQQQPQQQQQQPVVADIVPAAGGNHVPAQALRLDAARWLLLSRRAVLSGPPGCDKQLLQLPGMAEAAAAAARHWEGGLFKQSGSAGGAGSSGGTGKRTYLGVTPKCGSCKTCLHPSMKKACLVNRDRIAQGLPPVLPSGKAS